MSDATSVVLKLTINDTNGPKSVQTTVQKVAARTSKSVAITFDNIDQATIDSMHASTRLGSFTEGRIGFNARITISFDGRSKQQSDLYMPVSSNSILRF